MTAKAKRNASVSERFWEIIPGGLEVVTFVLLIVFSWQAPYVVSYFIMLYSLIWLEKSIHSSVHLIYTFRRLRQARLIDWKQRLKDLSSIPGLLPREVWHVVLMPTYNEPTEVLTQSIGAIVRAHYPLDRVIMVVGIEERAGPAGQQKAQALREQFSSSFAGFFSFSHPDGIVGEAKVKSANATWALRQLVPELISRGIDLDKVLVSNFDSDTQMHPDYLAVLTEAFIVAPDRLRCSYQPVPVFNNNIWEAPMFARLSATGTSFWQMIESSRTHRLVSFSSHALPLRAVLDVNGWDVTRISEDSRIFWQCYIHYKGKYRVVPLATTVSMDAVQDRNWWRTLLALYIQKRRWAWGIENLSLLGLNFVGPRCVRDIPWYKRLIHILRMVEGHHSWGTTAIVLALGGWLPSKLGGPEFSNTVLGQNYLIVTRGLLTAALAGILISIIVSARMLPPRPKHVSWRRQAAILLQWLLTPLVTIFFGSLPALDAHWRLMLGRYMEFQVMPKVRKSSTVVAGGIVAACVVLVLVGCARVPQLSAVSQPDWPLQANQTNASQIALVKTDKTELTLELADTPSEREQGLSGRNQVSYDGMLFVFDDLAPQPFWMKRMQFALDIVWLRDGRVVHLEEGLSPVDSLQTNPVTYGPVEPVDAAIELLAGQAKATGLELGATVDIVSLR
ncbi:MAG: DUF192 domain-containing protein [Parcubacteria group bacterium]